MGFNTTGCSKGWAVDNLLKVDLPSQAIREDSECQIHIVATTVVSSILGVGNVIIASICIAIAFGAFADKSQSKFLRSFFLIAGVMTVVMSILILSIASNQATRELVWILWSLYFSFFTPFAICSYFLGLSVLDTMGHGIAGELFSKKVRNSTNSVQIGLFITLFAFSGCAACLWVYTVRNVFAQKPSSHEVEFFQASCLLFGIGQFTVLANCVYMFTLFANFIENTINKGLHNLSTSHDYHKNALALVGRIRTMRKQLLFNSIFSVAFWFLHAFVVPLYATFVLPLHFFNSIQGFAVIIYTLAPQFQKKISSIVGSANKEKSDLTNAVVVDIHQGIPDQSSNKVTAP